MVGLSGGEDQGGRRCAGDYEYLWLLREALKSRPIAEAQKLLDTAAQSIVAGGGDAETMAETKTANATSNNAAHELREKIAAWIERLAK